MVAGEQHFGDVEASYSPFTFVALRAGYSVERDHRAFRFFDETTEQTVRGSVDSTGFTWGSVRLQYDFGVRTVAGPYMSSALPIAGFAVIEAKDLEEAIALVSKTPCAVAQGVVEVWPLQEMP